MAASTLKSAKEDFVSNLNGTSWYEIDQILLVEPLCVMFFSSMCQLLFQSVDGSTPSVSKESLKQHSLSSFLLNITLLVLPLLFSLTIWSDYLSQVLQAMAVTIFLVLCTCFTVQRGAWADITASVAQFDRTKVYINWYRAYVNIVTAVCILAVDFHVYPRRLAKTETYGTGLMDIFVGCFIMCNSVVCKEATHPRIGERSLLDKLESLWKVAKSCFPLTILGVARLVSTKASDYQEHLTEYGVHWNFFMTLAITRMACTVILCIIPPSKSLFLSISFAGMYQYLLSSYLAEYILRSNGRDEGFVSANREGIFSTFGYMSIYFAGVTVGQFLFTIQSSRPTTLPYNHHKVISSHDVPTLESNIKSCLTLLTISAAALEMVKLYEYKFEQVSRRMANLPFIMWTVHHSLLVLGLMKTVCVMQHVLDMKGWMKLSQYVSPLLDAVNYNGLLYFLMANILTGLVNLSINTLAMDTMFSLGIIFVYLLILNYVIYVLYVNDIRTKFW